MSMVYPYLRGFLTAALLVVLSMLVVVNMPSAAFASATSTQTITSSGSIHSFKTCITIWGISGALSESYLQFLAKFDMVNTDFRVSNIDSLRQLNPDVIVLGYRDMALMSDALPDWPEVNRHEAWFYHFTNGSRVVWRNIGGYGYNNYLMNPGNQDWRNYFTSFMKQAIVGAGMDGIFIDDVWSSFGWPDIYGITVPTYPGDYHQVVTDFLRYVKTQFSPNLVVFNGPDDFDYPMACDGKFGENFLTMIDTFKDINALSNLSGAGKYYIAFGRDIGQQMMTYCLSGFLLAVNGPNAYFSQGDFFATGTGFGGWYPEFETAQAIGSPTNAYYIFQSVYTRDFTNGKVLFNPTGNSFTVHFQGTYKLLNSVAITKIVVPPYSGAILLLS